MKGGDNGEDIIPGNSASSPLIRYVARIVADMEMPPDGKGEPLTPGQVSLLRAWIDQGAEWDAASSAHQFSFTFSPTLRFVTVSGNEAKFREHYWQPDGWNGGLEKLSLREQIDPDTRFTAEARFSRDDYKLRLELRRNEVGFIRSGWEQYRKYFDDSGGYYEPFSPPFAPLNRDIYLDTGRAWIDFGLNLPGWPEIVLGYEYQYREGARSTLNWGDVAQGGVTRKIAPATQELNEHTHIIKLDLAHEFSGLRLEDSFRGEFYELSTGVTNTYNAPSDTFMFENEREKYQHFQGVNVFRAEKQFTDWLFASGGYLYSKLDADVSVNVDTTHLTPGFAPEFHLASQRITLERESHLVNLNALLGPWKGFTFSSGVQSEWTRQKGFGEVSLDDLSSAPPLAPAPALLMADIDKASVSESAGVRYSGIPFSAVFADVQLAQESIGQYEQENGSTLEDFLRQTDFSRQSYDIRTGFDTSPWTWASFGAHYRRYDNESRYRHNQDLQSFFGFTVPGDGYSAFIRSRDLITDEFETRAVLRLARWIKTTLSWKLLTTDFTTDTDPELVTAAPGGPIPAGQYDAHIYSIGVTLTPHQRLYLSSTFSYQDSRTVSAGNDAPPVAPYRGGVYSALTSGTFVMDRKTDLLVAYAFSYADYSQANASAGLPLGLRYQQHGIQAGITRRINQNLTTRLQYGWFYYDEPTSGNLNNYTANAIFATLSYKFH